jgi:hypothetical protein
MNAGAMELFRIASCYWTDSFGRFPNRPKQFNLSS